MASTLRKSNLVVNIPSNINNLHSFYGKAKYAFLAVFALTIMFSAFVSHRVYGDSVIGTVETKIALKIDDKTKNVTTTQNTIGGALTQNGVAMAKNDITEPPLDTYLNGKNLDVQIVRAVPVLISDNGQSWPATSAYTQPADILKQLAVEVFPEDKISAELILDPAVEGAVGQKVIIKRAPVFTIYVDDTTKVVRSWATSVNGLLSEIAINMGPNDIVEPTRDSSLASVSEIVITRINYVDTTITEAIGYQTKTQYDFDLYRGKSRVIQTGVNGSKNVGYHIVYKNGIEVSRTVTSSELASSPVTQITAKGAMPTNDTYGWWPTIVSAANRYGVDAVKLYDVMMCESHGNADTWNGRGLFQYLQGTWDGASVQAGYGGKLITDGNAQIYVTSWKVNHDKSWGSWPTCGF